jgi:hypothetical protein
MNETYNVTYSAYHPGSTEVISEGTMPIHTTSFYLAEETVKAMFSGAEVIIRYTNKA